MFEIRHLYKTFDKKHVLRDMNLKLQSIENVLITGSSGAGKSTLLKILMGQLKPTSGTIQFENLQIGELDYKNIHTYRAQIGLIFQDLKLIPHFTNFENITAPLKINSQGKDDIITQFNKIHQLISQILDLDTNLFNQYPHQLSGGEKQIICVYRALIKCPRLVIADEPTSQLDSNLGSQISNLFNLFQDHYKTQFIVTTHQKEHFKFLKNTKHVHLHQGQFNQDINHSDLSFGV